MEAHNEQLRDNFIKNLSNYSACIQPYLRNVQERYAAAYFVVEGEKVDVTSYCKNEFQAAQSARALFEKSKHQ